VIWQLSNRADPSANALAKRHYTCQSPDSDQYVPPGRCICLVIPGCAVWVTSWPYAEYVKHAWPGAWVNSIFRNERRDLYLSSALILDAVSATLRFWSPPPLGLLSFVDETAVKRKRDPGRCYRKAGFKECGYTKAGKLALQLLPSEMPAPWPKSLVGEQMELMA
jgi:hypothetical protein